MHRIGRFEDYCYEQIELFWKLCRELRREFTNLFQEMFAGYSRLFTAFAS